MFEIKWEEKTIHFLDKLDFSVSSRIVKKINQLKENPFSKDVKRLKESDSFRLRVGDYRAIFDIQGNTIRIIKIGHRKNIYKY